MDKMGTLWKASYLQLRTYLYVVFCIAAINFTINFIITLSMGSSGDDNTGISIANNLTIFLIFIGIVLPTAFLSGSLIWELTAKSIIKRCW